MNKINRNPTGPRNKTTTCTKEWFCNTPDPDRHSRGSGLRNGIAGEIRLALDFCKGDPLGPCSQIHPAWGALA